MQQPVSLQDLIYSDEQLDLIKEASELETAMSTPGWRRLTSFMDGLVKVAHNAALAADTSNPAQALDLLREWQNKSDFKNQIELYAQSVIEQRDTMAPRHQLEAAILQEQLNGRNGSTGPGSTESY